MLMDGWSTGANEPVIAVSPAVHDRSFLIGVEDTTGVPHTAAYLTQLAKEYKKKVEDLGVDLVAITTDSASNMAKMRDDMAAEFPGPDGCSTRSIARTH